MLAQLLQPITMFSYDTFVRSLRALLSVPRFKSKMKRKELLFVYIFVAPARSRVHFKFVPGRGTFFVCTGVHIKFIPGPAGAIFSLYVTVGPKC
jgi:hypothetical protein